MGYPICTGCFLSRHYLPPVAVSAMIQAYCNNVINFLQAGTRKRLVSVTNKPSVETDMPMLVTGASPSRLHPALWCTYFDCFRNRAFFKIKKFEHNEYSNDASSLWLPVY